ncbi:MAG: tRNA pseudouridine(13) synthase TruD [Polyangiales bacterium]
MEELPFLTQSERSIGGVIRSSPEDFRVEEIPAYLPSGEGDHVYVRFEKRNLPTPDAVKAMARALGVDGRECGWAGLKDKNAVTVQWASFLRADVEKARSLALDGITVLEVSRHRNKLKTGHLHGNRFDLRVRGCVEGALAIAQRVAERIGLEGAPNYYGSQRFGREGKNVERGVRWLTGVDAAPRDGFDRKMLASSVQSWLFNRYLAERVSDGLLALYIQGDLAVRHPSDRVFAIAEEEALSTYASRACSATGPMFGPEMRWPDGAAKEREERVLAASGLGIEHFARAKGLAEGTRRAIRVCPASIEVSEEDAGQSPTLRFRFELPAGAYATAVLREFRKTDDEGLRSGPMWGIEPGPSTATEE